jgi:hypothetical protein
LIYSLISIPTVILNDLQHFLLGIPPDMSTIPYDNFLPANATAIRHAYSASYEKQVLALAHVSPEFTVTVVDGYALFKKILAHPQAYGYDPRTIHTSCLVGAFGEAPRSLCSDPDRFVFWDAAHVRETTLLVWPFTDGPSSLPGRPTSMSPNLLSTSS